MRAIAILGPGRHDKELTLLRASGLDVSVSEVLSLDRSVELIVVLGGDGTIHRALPKLIRSKLPVLLVPSGSGNDLARALKISSTRKSAELARDFVRGRTHIREIDVGIVADEHGNETPFCCVGGVGLDAIAAEFANRMPRWLRSRGGYLLSAARALFTAPSLHLRIYANGGEMGQTSCLFSFASTPSCGGGLRIAPDANLEDGKFDCVLVHSMGRAQMLSCAVSLMRGTHLRRTKVGAFRAEHLRVESDEPTSVYADGEYVCQTPAEVRIIPRSLQLLSGV